MKNHALWHMLGCALPLLLIMILPSLGVSSNVSYFIFVVLMFACHLMMFKAMGHGSEYEDGDSKEKGDKHHGCH